MYSPQSLHWAPYPTGSSVAQFCGRKRADPAFEGAAAVPADVGCAAVAVDLVLLLLVAAS